MKNNKGATNRVRQQKKQQEKEYQRKAREKGNKESHFSFHTASTPPTIIFNPRFYFFPSLSGLRTEKVLFILDIYIFISTHFPY